MAEFIVPSVMLMAREAAESPGTGGGIDVIVRSGTPSGFGADVDPPQSQVSGSLPTSPPNGWGHNTVSIYASDATGDTNVDQSVAYAAALDLCLGGGSTVTVKRNGADERIDNVGSVWTGGSGTFLVDPSDIGLTGIPTDPTLLQSSQLVGHPSVFVRQGGRVRALARQAVNVVVQELASPAPIIQPPIQVFTVLRAPTFSAWVLAMDGVCISVMVQHPVGSNLRRPADIWNAVFSRIVGGGGDVLKVFANDPVVAGAFVPSGVFTRLSHIDWARCTGVFDGDVVTPILEPLYLPPV